MGILVICSYKAKAGQEAEVRALMQEHLPMLQRLGLATARPGTMMEGKEGVFVEVFEWTSEAASRSALDYPDVKRVWGRFAEISDFVPLASVAEAARPFAHFSPV